MLVFNNYEEMEVYYNEDTNTYEFVENGELADVKFNFDLRVSRNISARNLYGEYIEVENIDVRNAYAIWVKVENIKAVRIKARTITAENIDAIKIRASVIRAKHIDTTEIFIEDVGEEEEAGV